MLKSKQNKMMDTPDNIELSIQKSCLSLPSTTPITEAIARLGETPASCLLVVEGQNLVGILTERDVVRMTASRPLLEALTLGDLMTQNVITLKLSEIKDIFDLSRIFSKNRIRHLPVLDEANQILGVITPHSIRYLLKPEYLLRYVRVLEVMQSEVIQGLTDDSVLSLVQKMATQRVSCVVIIDPQTSRPIGIVTERDIVNLHQLGLDCAQVSAQQVMSQPLYTMQPQDSLWSVHQRMQEFNVRRIVITDLAGKLAGVVTQTQMMKMLDPTEMYYVMQQMQDVIDRQLHELQRLNQKLQVANIELDRLSTLDDLTQLMNRRQLNKFMAQEWQRLSHLGQPLSFVMCDVDYFKAYNDTYGHLAGDQCLMQIAQVLLEVTQKTGDLVARYGGEEFAIVLPNTNTLDAESVAREILTQVHRLTIPHAASLIAGHVTVSLGVATVIPTLESEPVRLMQLADQLLYQSKRQGRNTYNCQVLTTCLTMPQSLPVALD